MIRSTALILGSIFVLTTCLPAQAIPHAAFPEALTLLETYSEPRFALARRPIAPWVETTVHVPSIDGVTPADPVANGYPSGFPVLVFLHGAGQPPSLYADLGASFAKKGWIVVMPDSTNFFWLPGQQIGDAVAMHGVLQADPLLVRVGQSTSTVNSLITSIYDRTRVCIGGHSQGGGIALTSVGNFFNVPYAACVTWAPWEGPQVAISGQPNVYSGIYKLPVGSAAPAVTWGGASADTPLMFIVGDSDIELGSLHSFTDDAYDWFDKTSAYSKAVVVMELEREFSSGAPLSRFPVGHLDPILNFGGIRNAVFERSMIASYCFLEAMVYDRPYMLHEVSGQGAFDDHMIVKNVDSHWRLPVSYVRDGHLFTMQEVNHSLPIAGFEGPAWCFASLRQTNQPLTFPTHAGNWWLGLNPVLLIPPYTALHFTSWQGLSGWNYIKSGSLGPAFGFTIQTLANTDPHGPSGPSIGFSNVIVY